MPVLKLLGPFFCFIGLIMSLVVIGDIVNGELKYGPKNGPKELITRAEQPERFAKIAGSFLALSGVMVVIGVVISIKAYKKKV